MAADPDPYFALPKLYGGPAYARPKVAVPEAERPFDPDDLPIVAAMSDDERVVVATLAPSVLLGAGGSAAMPAAGAGSPSEGANARGTAGKAHTKGTPGGSHRRRLRALTNRLGPRRK